MSELDCLLGPDLVVALQRLVDERVEAALAVRAPQGSGSPWLTLADAATRLQVSQRTIARKVREGGSARRLLAGACSCMRLTSTRPQR